jgi:hypothetical protein
MVLASVGLDAAGGLPTGWWCRSTRRAGGDEASLVAADPVVAASGRKSDPRSAAEDHAVGTRAHDGTPMLSPAIAAAREKDQARSRSSA